LSANELPLHPAPLYRTATVLDANVTMFDDGANRSMPERCCDAPDTFLLWPSLNATEQAAPWTAASRPTGVKCKIVGAALKCTAPAPITGAPLWTFAWHDYPACMLANDAQLPASPMRTVVPKAFTLE